jgi:hypothetical protein
MGNPISLFQTKPTEAKKPAKRGGNKQMVYLLATVETLVKKGLRKQCRVRSASATAQMTLLAAIPIPNRELGPVTWSK